MGSPMRRTFRVLGTFCVRPRAAIGALVLLAAGTVLTLLVVAGMLRERLLQERVASAQMALQSVAASVARASDLGVPLDKMVGLDELVRSRVTEASGLVALSLLDRNGAVVWRSSDHGAAAPIIAATGAAVIGDAAIGIAANSTAATGTVSTPPFDECSLGCERHTLEVPVGRVGTLQADFVPPNMLAAFSRVAIVVIGVAIGLSIPLLELARLSDVGRDRFVSKLLQRQVDAIRRGDFHITWRLSGAQAADGPLPFLRDQVFLLNEQFQRAARLLGSLRRTEPDADKRARMGALLEDLRRRFRFSDDAGVLDRRSWPDADTARCFAALAVLLGNLQTGFSLADLTQWSLGLVIGARGLAVRWPTRLVAGFGAAAVANLFNAVAASGPINAVGSGWAEIIGNVAAGIATTLAARAAIEAGRAHTRSVVASTLLTGTVAGPIVVFAFVSALNTFADPTWLYFVGAGLAVVAAGWLIYRVADESVPVSRPQRERLALAPLLGGAVWGAATAVFTMNAGSPAEALWLSIAQIPGLLLLASAPSRPRAYLAVALGLVAAIWLTRPLLPQPLAGWLNPEYLAWLGSACTAGALSAVPNCGRAPPSRAVTAFPVGIAVALVVILLIARFSPGAADPVALAIIVVGLAALFVARRFRWRRGRIAGARNLASAGAR